VDTDDEDPGVAESAGADSGVAKGEETATAFASPLSKAVASDAPPTPAAAAAPPTPPTVAATPREKAKESPARRVEAEFAVLAESGSALATSGSEGDFQEVTAKLAAGVPFVKHCSDGKTRARTLILSKAGDKVGWKVGQSEASMLALKDVLEVRAGTSIDPSTVGDKKHPNGLAGTKVLRRCADGPGVCKKAFSLILADRSLDVELSSERECARYRAALERLVLDAKL